MKLARPPHYIDKIPDGHSSFDAYEMLGYQYLGASFDGGGWRRSSGHPRREVQNMVESLRMVLEKDPDALSGQIIFEKDGYNMSLEALVVEALPLKLDLLKRYGYQVLPVGELVMISPYTDIGPEHQAFSAVQLLERKGVPVLYRDNTFRPDQLCKVSEMLSWLSHNFQEGEGSILPSGGKPGGIKFGNSEPENSESRNGQSEKRFGKDGILTVGLLLKMVPQAAVSACGIKTRDRKQGVSRWMAVVCAAETLSLETNS